jgi:ribosomal protein S27E
MIEHKTKQHKTKSDRYSKSRGGNSNFLDIYCSKCKYHILIYQKDGSGSLIRLYLDRIFDPPVFSSLQFDCNSKSDVPALKCLNCHELIAIPMVYERENRLAFSLVRGKYIKKKSGGKYPPSEKTLGS